MVVLLLGGGASASGVLPAGSLDPTFNVDGIADTPVATTGTANGFAPLGDGSIVVVGGQGSLSSDDGANSVLARYCADGSVDDGSSDSGSTCSFNGFGNTGGGGPFDGVASYDLSGDGRGDALNAVTQEFGSQLVAVGTACVDGGSGSSVCPAGRHAAFLVARFNQDGSLDNSFGSNGVEIAPISTNGDAVATSVTSLFTNQGPRIVVGGYKDSGGAGDYQMTAALFDGNNGNLITHFDLTAAGGHPEKANAVAAYGLNKSGFRILLAGSTNPDGTRDRFKVAALTVDQSDHITAGPTATTSFGTVNDDAEAIALGGGSNQGQPQEVAVAGTSVDGGGHLAFAVAVYKPATLALDRRFNGTGTTTFSFSGSADDVARGVAFEPDGKLVVGGLMGEGDLAALARLNPDGSFDTTFGSGGKSEVDLGGLSSSAGVALDNAGRIYFAGTDGGAFALARFLGASFNPVAVSVSPNVSPPGTQVNVNASGFDPYQLVDVYVDTSDLALVQADGFGFVNTTIAVPVSALPGTHWLTVVGRGTDANQAQTQFTVAADWQNFGFDNSGSRNNTFENALSPANAAKLASTTFNPLNGGNHNGVAATTPAAHGQSIYVAGRDGQLFVLDQRTGQPYNSPPPNPQPSYHFADSSPAWGTYCPNCGQGFIAVGSNDGGAPGHGELYLYNDQFEGQPYCTSNPVGQIHSSPIVVTNPNDGQPMIIVGSNDGKLYAFDPNCNIIWTSAVTVSGGITSSPAGGTPLVVGGLDGRVYGINLLDGTTLWCAPSCSTNFKNAAFVSSPAVVDGSVFIGGQDKKLYSIDPDSGAVNWTKTLGGSILSSPAVADGIVYVGATDGKLYALDEDTGTQIWTAVLGQPVDGSPAVANGLVAVTTKPASGSGKLYVFDASTGRRLYRAVVGPQIGSPIIVNGMVVVASGKGINYFTAPFVAPATRPDPASLHPDHALPVRSSQPRPEAKR